MQSNWTATLTMEKNTFSHGPEADDVALFTAFLLPAGEVETFFPHHEAHHEHQ